jgi:hypothetical protein
MRWKAASHLVRGMCDRSNTVPTVTLNFLRQDEQCHRPLVAALAPFGAIGVGGAPSAEADEVCAEAGLDAIRNRVRSL